MLPLRVPSTFITVNTPQFPLQPRQTPLPPANLVWPPFSMAPSRRAAMGRALPSIRGRHRFWLLDFHLFAAAYGFALACLRTKHLSSAYKTTISLAKLTHDIAPRTNPSVTGRYFFCSAGSPQCCSVPSPPRVTRNSAPHFLQTYRFPT